MLNASPSQSPDPSAFEQLQTGCSGYPQVQVRFRVEAESAEL
jgi:hypothetical protein